MQMNILGVSQKIFCVHFAGEERTAFLIGWRNFKPNGYDLGTLL